MNMKIILLILIIPLIGRSQNSNLNGTWEFKGSFSINLDSSPEEHDTAFHANGKQKITISSLATVLHSNSELMNFGSKNFYIFSDTLKLLCYNPTVRLTESEIEKMSDQELKQYFKNFAKSKILNFLIKKEGEKIRLIRIH